MPLADIPPHLIEQCRRRDDAAIGDLMRRISPDLYRIVYSMLRDHDDTDEVVQETLLRIFRHIGKLKDPTRFAPWAMRIATNEVQTWRVKKGRNRFYEMDEGLEPMDGVIVVAGRPARNPRERATDLQVREQIEQAMAQLPKRQQTAIVLYEIEGCSVREIAGAMACSEGAVKFNLHEARKKLRLRLGHLVEGLRRLRQSRAAAGDKS